MSDQYNVNSLVKSVAVFTSSQTVTFPQGFLSVRVFGTKLTDTAFIRSGNTGVVAAATDFPIGSAIESFDINPTDDTLAIISPLGTGTVYFCFSAGGK